MVEQKFRVIEGIDPNSSAFVPMLGRRDNLKCLLSLTPIERDVYDLHIMGSYTLRAVGEKLRCSARTVSRIQERCFDKLSGGATKRERNLSRSLKRNPRIFLPKILEFDFCT